MGKKRTRDDPPSKMATSPSDSDSEDFDIINVTFEWFNFTSPDSPSLQTLLRQLLAPDAALLPISRLADRILAQPSIGSTVKIDGEASDAYAFLTALSAGAAELGELAGYLLSKAAAGIQPVLEQGMRGERKVGLVLGERLINIPTEVAPPMYACLVDELEAAVEDGEEEYAFEYFLLVSKVYREVESTLDEGRERPAKKARESSGGEGFFYFHPEDEVFARYALASGTFRYTKEDEANPDTKRAFQEAGVKCEGYMMLIEGARFPEAVRAVGEFAKAPGQ